METGKQVGIRRGGTCGGNFFYLMKRPETDQKLFGKIAFHAVPKNWRNSTGFRAIFSNKQASTIFSRFLQEVRPGTTVHPRTLPLRTYFFNDISPSLGQCENFGWQGILPTPRKTNRNSHKRCLLPVSTQHARLHIKGKVAQ